jgi:phosphohistidine phosphatase
MRRLIILRHAKAAAGKPGRSDHDRPLAPRGELALPAVAQQLTALLDGRPIDVVLSSPSTRTRQTVAGIAAALGPARIRFARRLYLADLDDLLELLSHQPDHTVLLCGHNPGLHQLALALLAESAPPALAHDLPTAGLVVIDFDGDWTPTGAVTATLRAFEVPGD